MKGSNIHQYWMERSCVTYVLAWWCLLDKASQLQKARLDSTSSCYVNNITALVHIIAMAWHFNPPPIGDNHRLRDMQNSTDLVFQIFYWFTWDTGNSLSTVLLYFQTFEKKADIFGERPLTTIKHWNDLQVGARPGKKKRGQILTLDSHPEAIDAKL